MPGDGEDTLPLLADPAPRQLDGAASGDDGAGSGADGAGRGEGAAAHAALSADAPSVLDAYGEELTAVMTPVSITMALTVLLVRFLSASSGGSGPTLGTVYYTEEAGDTASQRVRGALVNALIYVAFVGAFTGVIYCLFKHGYTRVIWGYMGLSGVSIFGFMGGSLLLRLLQELGIALDGVTFVVLLWNWSVVGVVATFALPLPLRLKQAYLVFISLVTALWFTHLPELTTWALLVLMALYDVAAVLSPAGPLRALLELAQEREEDIPALIYESRPMRRLRVGSGSAEQGSAAAVADVPQRTHGDAAAPQSQPPQEIAMTVLPRVRSPRPSPPPAPDEEAADTHAPLLPPPAPRISAGHAASLASSDGERSVKLGLGDFIFYSLLVGRAAMTDLLTACACYLGIVAGLAATLAALAVVQHALPALPISVALGVLLYVVARWVLEPFMLPLSTSLVYF